MFVRFLKDASGSTAIEYAIIAGLISIGIIVGVTDLGDNTEVMYDEINNSVTNAGQ